MAIVRGRRRDVRLWRLVGVWVGLLRTRSGRRGFRGGGGAVRRRSRVRRVRAGMRRVLRCVVVGFVKGVEVARPRIVRWRRCGRRMVVGRE